MNWRQEWRALAWTGGLFLVCFYLPVGTPRFDGAVDEALALVRWYAREHVILCLVPAFLIAGAISVFVSQAAVMKYLGARAKKVLAYGVASTSGSILAVCSCTVLPLFAGIHRMGAGLGPATAFLFSGPALNVMAIILTARVLGFELGLARAVGAVAFSIVIGLVMALIFRREEAEKTAMQAAMPEPEVRRPLWQNGLYFLALVGILVFANWAPAQRESGVWQAIFAARWPLTGLFAVALAVILVAWFGVRWQAMVLAALPAGALAVLVPGTPLAAFVAGVIGLAVVAAMQGGEAGEWLGSSWGLARQILPLLLIGVLVAGALLGSPEGEGLIPSGWVAAAVGGNGLRANLFAAVAGAFMYFATLTEVPILQGLMANGMGDGPALALLLAGPALSLPNMLVIRSVLGSAKTAIYVALVVVMATCSGLLYGALLQIRG